MANAVYLMLILLVMLSTCYECRGEKHCHTWMFQDSTPQKNCVCRGNLTHIFQCYDSKNLELVMQMYFCMFYSEDTNATLVGSCPYSYNNVMISANVTEFKSTFKQCKHLHRKGRLCGECEDNYTLPVYSYNMGCVQCRNTKYGWIKFITAAFFPLTMFYLLVITFRISATSSTLNGYVLVSQT